MAFTPEIIEKIGSEIKEADPKKLDNLQARLSWLADQYVPLLKSFETNKTGRQRANWIAKTIIRPTQKVLDALIPMNVAMFSNWPDENLDVTWEEVGSRNAELTEFIAWAQKIHLSLVDRPRPWTKPLMDLRYALVWDLLLIYIKLWPDKAPTRTSYNKAPESKGRQRREAGVSNPAYLQSRFADFVRTSAETILGGRHLLNHETQTAITKWREMKKTRSKPLPLFS